MNYNILHKAIKIKFLDLALNTFVDKIYENFVLKPNSITVESLYEGMHLKEIRSNSGLLYKDCRITNIENVRKWMIEIRFDFKYVSIDTLPEYIAVNLNDTIYVHKEQNVYWKFIP
jgi:hypothetical protein